MSSSVVVVQAKVRSGSLITAHAALELGRDVFAVPGRIFDELSLGTNGLLADGAIPANGVDDVLGHLSFCQQQELFPTSRGPDSAGPPTNLLPDNEPRVPGFNGTVLDHIPRGGQGKTVEDLANALGVRVDQVLGALLELELAGRIERLPGPLYTR